MNSNKPASEVVVSINPAEAELCELRARRKALETARQQRLEAEAPAQRIAAERQALADEEAVDAAEREHGPVGKHIAVVCTDLGVIIVKRPHANTYRKFQDQGKAESKYFDALVRPCLVHPTLAEFENICAELPATLGRVASAVTVLAGFRAEDLSVK